MWIIVDNLKAFYCLDFLEVSENLFEDCKNLLEDSKNIIEEDYKKSSHYNLFIDQKM